MRPTSACPASLIGAGRRAALDLIVRNPNHIGHADAVPAPAGRQRARTARGAGARAVLAAGRHAGAAARALGGAADAGGRTGGPARYVQLVETGQKIGFITPLTHNFCESCNRVRLTCTGELYMCLGQEDMADLRGPLRASPQNDLLETAIRDAITRKPKGHDFDYSRQRVDGQVSRHMSHTGG